MYSVVMPTRPDEPFIDEAVNSILSQTLPPLRLHIVVNGPGASLWDAAAELLSAHPEVEIHLRDEPGQAGALAAGIQHVDTAYVAFLDADDLWEVDKQERQLARLEARPDLDAVSCEAVNFRVRPDGSVQEGTRTTARLFPAVTFRTSAFTRYGLPDESWDHFVWLYRWWSLAQSAGISTEGMAFRGLRRRVHDANGWVTDRERGRSELLGELRRIHRSRDLADPAPEESRT